MKYIVIRFKAEPESFNENSYENSIEKFFSAKINHLVRKLYKILLSKSSLALTIR